MSDNKYTIAVDFDGVIHRYDSPWIDAETIPDPPVAGAIDWLNRIADDFDIVIFTTRGKSQEGRNAVGAYLRAHGCALSFPITAEKPPALIYLDDRAYRFDGSNFPTAQPQTPQQGSCVKSILPVATEPSATGHFLRARQSRVGRGVRGRQPRG